MVEEFTWFTSQTGLSRASVTTRAGFLGLVTLQMYEVFSSLNIQ